MLSLLMLALAGVAGQLVDGALGMAFGVTSTTVLLTAGIAPAVASASTHLAEVGTTLASGASHWGFGNIDWPKIGWLAVPGAASAFAGAMLLTSIPAEAAKPVVAVVLFGMGVYILTRFAFTRSKPVRVRHVPRWFLSPLGVVAGFLDAVGGGGWGPIGSSTLLASGRMQPRKVVGTMAAAEFLVTIGASVGFLIGLTAAEIPLQVVSALLVGGVLAAPFAAWVVRLLSPRILGTLVGGIIVLTNASTFLYGLGQGDLVTLPLYAALIAAWVTTLVIAVRGSRRDQPEQAEHPADPPERSAGRPGSAARAKQPVRRGEGGCGEGVQRFARRAGQRGDSEERPVRSPSG